MLFIIALPVDKTGREKTADGANEGGRNIINVQTQALQSEDSVHAGTTAKSGQEERQNINCDYEREQEEKLRALLSAMDGVGEVEVMLTFLSTGEQVVEKDEPVSRANTVEKDSEGGSRTVTQYEKGDTSVFRSETGEPFVVKTIYPRVEGVLVVAEGAGDGTINRSITEAVQALFGVEAHRVRVLPMGKEKANPQ